MRWSLRLGRLFGIRIELHITFVIFIGWIAISRGLLTGDVSRALTSVLLLILVFTCVLLHELGHALAARRYGIQTRDIILLPIGGLARLARMPDKPQQEMVVAIAGPLVNVVIALALILLGGPVRSASEVLQGGIIHTLLMVNVAMVLFNLVPAFPMDGGRILRAGLAMAMPYAKATRIASVVGQGMALLFGIYGLFNNNVMLMFIALFVFLAASEERAVVETRATLSGLPVRNAMVTDFYSLDVNDPLQRAVDHLMAGSQQDFPVLDHGSPVGMLTRADLVRALQARGAGSLVGDAMQRDQDYADAGEPLDEAIQRMREKARTALPVLHHGGLVGLITLENVGDLLTVRDALRRFQGAARM